MKNEDLRQYIPLKVLLRSIDDEINELYYPVTSPNGKQTIGGTVSSTTPSNPTALAVERVLRLKQERIKILAKIKRIETYVDAIDDYTAKSIARYHYLLGYSWSRTAYKIYGHYNGETTRKYLNRYIKT